MQVTANGAAAKAGIQPTFRNKYGEIELGDIITKIDDYKIKNKNDLLLTLEKFQPGAKAELTIIRGEKERKVEVTLGGN